MNDREVELLLKTAQKLNGSPLDGRQTELLQEYYSSGTGSVFNKMRMAMQMVLNIDTSMFELKKRDFDPVRETLKELRAQAEQLEEAGEPGDGAFKP
mgnify:CR=1 FL=1